MQNKNGLDAISMLTDVLFQETDGPAPSFPANKRKALVRLGSEPGEPNEAAESTEPSPELAWE